MYTDMHHLYQSISITLTFLWEDLQADFQQNRSSGIWMIFYQPSKISSAENAISREEETWSNLELPEVHQQDKQVGGSQIFQDLFCH